MSIATMILGQSGTGKTTSLRNMKPDDVLLIQAVKKPLPFRSKEWVPCTKANPSGSILVTDCAPTIVGAMQRTPKPIIIIDDFQYILANEFMRRVLDPAKGNEAFAKYNEIAKNAWDILMCAGRLPDSTRVYILAHTQEDESGHVKAKSIGKLLDEKITMEGLLTIVMRTAVINGQYLFSTQNSGLDTVKTPLGMFDEPHIPNDLASVDKCIADYYELTQPA
jgi:hypothetical protein